MSDVITKEDEIIAKWHEGDKLTPDETAKLDRIMNAEVRKNTLRGPARLSIYPKPMLIAALEVRTHPHAAELRNRSAWINTFAERYVCAIDWAMPSFTVNEWCLLFAVLKGCWIYEPCMSFFTLADQIDQRLPGHPDLAARVRRLDRIASLAVVDAAERWWSQPPLAADEDPAARVLAIVGAHHITE